MARRALDRRPPTGFRGNLVVEGKGEHAGRLDVKHGGITLITNIARVLGLGSGLTERSTVKRLRGAAAAGRIDTELQEGLEEAFGVLWRIAPRSPRSLLAVGPAARRLRGPRDARSAVAARAEGDASGSSRGRRTRWRPSSACCGGDGEPAGAAVAVVPPPALDASAARRARLRDDGPGPAPGRRHLVRRRAHRRRGGSSWGSAVYREVQPGRSAVGRVDRRPPPAAGGPAGGADHGRGAERAPRDPRPARTS